METNIERRDEILRLRSEGMSYGEITKKLNCNKSTVAFYCSGRYLLRKVDEEKERAKKEYEEIVCNLVKECQNISQVCKSLGKRATNNNYLFIEKIIEKYNLDISHFCVDYSNKKHHKPYTKEEIFCENSPMSTSKARDATIKFGVKEWRCERCRRTDWEGEKIPLQIHHINGDNRDNRIENIQLLCPNCHTLTDTYCGKKKKRKLPQKHSLIEFNPHNREIKEKNSVLTENGKICPICGKEFRGWRNFCSDECYNIYLKNTYKKFSLDINKEKLIETFKKYKNFTQVGKYFGVSDKTIAKWCKSFDLPHKSKEMKEYLDNI